MAHDDHVIGPRDARVTLVEYGDYECPHCGHAYLVLQVVLAELADQVRFTFRHFPLSAHPHALTAAQAVESVATHAGEPAFWAMHAMLYENQDALEIDDLLGYAEAAGADVEAVAGDLSKGTMQDRVERDVHRGMKEGVSGTPAFFINGRRFDGNWTDADAFTAVLQAAAREDVLH